MLAFRATALKNFYNLATINPMENKTQLSPLPETEKTYNYFDDGKIRESRRSEVTVTHIIPFNEIEEEILTEWKSEVKKCHWLYAKKTDYFIKGLLHSSNKDFADREIVFVRTVDGGWFSLGWWGGELDVSGELFKLMLNNKNRQ